MNKIKKYLVVALTLTLVTPLLVFAKGKSAKSSEKTTSVAKAAGSSSTETSVPSIPNVDGKTLVVYFSYSGTTEKVANAIAKEINAPIVKIEAEVPYTSADVDWTDKNSRTQVEINDKIHPAIANSTYDAINKVDYDTIIIGHPIWGGIEPLIINTLLEHYDGFDGKNVYTFSTSYSSAGDKAFADIKNQVKNAKDYLHLSNRDMSKVDSLVKAWVSKNNLK